jgi:hypothetical protein
VNKFTQAFKVVKLVLKQPVLDEYITPICVIDWLLPYGCAAWLSFCVNMTVHNTKDDDDDDDDDNNNNNNNNIYLYTW